MSAFGGIADVNHCVGECPLIAISGLKEGFQQPEIFQNDLYRKPRCEHCQKTLRTLAFGRTQFEVRLSVPIGTP